MKNSVETEKYRVSRGLNILARRIVEEEFSPEMVTAQINQQFNYISKKERMGLMREVINRSYRYAWSVPEVQGVFREENDFDAIMPLERINFFLDTIKECVAVIIARQLLSALQLRSREISLNGSFGSSFYRYCLSRIKKSNIISRIKDIEVLEIHLKQMGHLIRKTTLFDEAFPRRKYDSNIPALYSDLFQSFWERVRWNEIFPSNPAASRELSQCKSILIDIIARQKGKFSVREIANEFFALTGFSNHDNMFMISFLDFYFFTWLSHFGILAYCRPVPEVCMKVTPFGREFLAHLRERR